MVVSHNREIQIEFDDHVLYRLANQLINSRARPGDQRCAGSTFAKKAFLPTQLWTSANEGKQGAVSRHKLPYVCRRSRKAAILFADPRVGQGAAPIARAAHSGDFGVGCQ